MGIIKLYEKNHPKIEWKNTFQVYSCMKYNDLDLSNWKALSINTDSLWIIKQRDKSGKHKNIYHGNFIPQIPNQLMRRYTKENETILEPFMGSGTTLFECETLHRKYIGKKRIVIYWTTEYDLQSISI